jgi:hypothetical protein
MSKVARLTAAAIMAVTGLMTTVVTSTSARADNPPFPFVGYHWCPGQPFDPAWGPQWDPTTCHDAHHRDADGTIHTFDYYGPSPFQNLPERPFLGP